MEHPCENDVQLCGDERTDKDCSSDAHVDESCSSDARAGEDRLADGRADACADESRLTDDERFMHEALAEARAAAALGEVPIGAVVAYEGEVIARAHNRRELDEDPSAHAEFAAMLEAARVLGHWRLTGCTVYVTLEPCLMCAGLMVNARIDRCVYGASDPKGGAVGTLYDVSHDPRLNHEFEVTTGVLEEECALELKTFFARLRARRAEEKRARRAAAASEQQQE